MIPWKAAECRQNCRAGTQGHGVCVPCESEHHRLLPEPKPHDSEVQKHRPSPTKCAHMVSEPQHNQTIINPVTQCTKHMGNIALYIFKKWPDKYLSKCLLIWRCAEAQSSTKSAETKTFILFFSGH